MKLSFFCVGPQRTATTWLYRVLAEQRQVEFPQGVKETMFFDTRYAKGIQWYLWHFRNADSAAMCGEIAPSYFDQPVCWERIRKHFPEAKIIINVRNPVDRSYSLFRHHVSKGRIPNDFEKAIERMPRILSSSHYGKYCPQWEHYFPDRVKYVVQEDIEARPELVVDDICQFLQLETMPLPEVAHERVNRAAAPRNRWLARALSMGATSLRSLRLHGVVEWGKRVGLTSYYRDGGEPQALGADTRARLARMFESDVRWLERRLEREFSEWAK